VELRVLLAWAKRNQPAIFKLIREFVECESPSDSPKDVRRFVDLLVQSISDIATCRITPEGCLIAKFRLPGRNKTGQVLALGHADTVWPLGTLKTMQFRRAEGRLLGPGVLDMKSGLALFTFAVRAALEHELQVTKDVTLLVNPDEETGSRRSRAVTESLARKSTSVLVLEPGTGLEGKAKTARKGIGDFHLKVHGVASHAGVDFEKGASAVLELARQLDVIAGFTDLANGVTVNPGVISGGTRSNVIAAEASAHIDIRVPSERDAKVLERRFRSLKPFDKRCRLELTGGLNRPPMERTKGTVALFERARKLASEMGVTLAESSTGGGSDGNFTAALGVPTLDGIGAVGEGAHAAHESILINRIPDRVALLAGLLVSYTS
jgi:glutamate carboxypeptidase